MVTKWLDELTGEINGGGNVEFVGIVRGQGLPAIRYYAETVEEIVDGLELDEWVYVVREVI